MSVLWFRLTIFALVIGVSLARYRRSEGNEDSEKYYRPKYVYKFHEEDDSAENSAQAHKMNHKHEYKYYLQDDEDEGTEKHYLNNDDEDKEEQVTHYGYNNHQNHHHLHHQYKDSSMEDNSSVQKNTEHHVEIEHEHGTSHQSFTMHHFPSTRMFMKKKDYQYVHKPVAITKHSFKVV